jgi:hypothetical protein
LMDEKHVLDIIEHPNEDKYNNQKIFVIFIVDCVYLVPFVRDGKKVLFKNNNSEPKSHGGIPKERWA